MRQATLTLGRSSDRLSSAAAVVLAVLLYLAAHAAVRLAMGLTLGLDDAEQALFAQEWSWGYRFRQPPLFTWLLLGLGEVVGVNALALSLLRYALLAITYVCLYLVALRWIADRRLAALAVFSFALIYVFAFYAHHDLTHTTALGAMIAVSLYVFARLVERPTAPVYALLGACFGLGMLAKWNFVMLPAGLLLTCLILPRFRGLVLTWRMALAAGAMAAVVAPTALWILAHGQTVGSVSEDILAAEGEAPSFLGTLAEGTLALLKSALVFPQPFLPIFLVVFGAALWRAVRAPAPPHTDEEAPAVTPEFLGALIAVTLGLHWLLVPTLGAVTFTERWMHPALMVLPVFLFALIERGLPGPRAVAVYLVVLAAFVAAALGARVVRYGLGADYCGKCRELVPFEELAAGLRAAGFERGTIVVDGFHVGGNLRVAFPDSRVIDPAYPPEVWPEASGAGGGQCLAAWWADDGHADALKGRIDAYLAGVLDVPPEAPRRAGRIEAPMRGSKTRTYVLGYELWPRGAGACR